MLVRVGKVSAASCKICCMITTLLSTGVDLTGRQVQVQQKRKSLVLFVLLHRSTASSYKCSREHYKKSGVSARTIEKETYHDYTLAQPFLSLVLASHSLVFPIQFKHIISYCLQSHCQDLTRLPWGATLPASNRVSYSVLC